MSGDYPGVAPVKLTQEPLGTQGELTAGPNDLDPSIPEERDELVSRGFMSDDPPEETAERGFGPVGDPEPLFETDTEPELPPLL